MIQKSTIIWLGLAAVAGTALFYTSESVHQASLQLGNLQEKIISEQDGYRVLEAEWSYLNQPARLEKLAQQLSDLKPVQAGQLITIDRLPTAAAVAPPPEKPRIPVTAQKMEQNESLQKAALTLPAEKHAEHDFDDVLARLGGQD